MNFKEIATKTLEWVTAPLFANVYIYRFKNPVRIPFQASQEDITNLFTRSDTEAEITELPRGKNNAEFPGAKHTYLAHVVENEDDPGNFYAKVKMVPAGRLNGGHVELYNTQGVRKPVESGEEVTLKNLGGHALIIAEQMDFHNKQSDILVFGAILYRPKGQPPIPEK